MIPEIELNAVPGLMSALNDIHAGIRKAAAMNIGRMGRKAQSALPEIVRVLEDPDISVKEAAAWALGEMGSAATPYLVHALADSDISSVAERAIRNHSFEIFQNIVYQDNSNKVACPNDIDATDGNFKVPSYFQALKHRLEEVRYAAILSLVTCDGDADLVERRLWHCLEDESTKVRMAAAISLGWLSNWEFSERKAQFLVTAVIKNLHKWDMQELNAAKQFADLAPAVIAPYLFEQLSADPMSTTGMINLLEILGQTGKYAAPAIPAVINIIRSDTPAIEHALRALGKICNGNSAAINVLVKAMGQTPTRIAAIQSLGEIRTPIEMIGPPLIQALASNSREVCVAATDSLVSLGSTITPLLIKNLQSADDQLQQQVFNVIGALGSAAAPAITHLLSLLQTGSNSEKSRAATTLGLIGEPAKEAIPELAKLAISGSDSEVEASAAAALGRIGEPSALELDRLIRMPLTDDQKANVVRALGDLGPAAVHSAPPLMESMVGNNPAISSLAAEALESCGTGASGIIKQLEEALMHRDRNIRSRAASILANVGPAGSQAVPALIKTIKLGRIPARKHAALTLAKFADESPAVIPALTKMLLHRDRDVVVAAAIALGEIGEASHPAAVNLIRALAHRKSQHSPDYRLVSGSIIRETSTTLVKIGKSAVPAIIRSLTRRNVHIGDELLSLFPIWGQLEPSVKSKPVTRRYLVRVLAEIGKNADEAIPILTQIIQDSDADLRAEAADALRRIGIRENCGVTQLATAMRHRNPSVRAHAAAVLCATGKKARLAVPALIRAVKDRDIEVRKKAVEALGEIGTAAKEAVIPLVKALNTHDREVSHLAAEAIGKIGPQGVKTVEALLNIIIRCKGNGRWYAVSILGDMGSEAVVACPTISRLVNDPDQDVAEAASNTLRKLQLIPLPYPEANAS